LGGAKTAH